MISKKIYDDAVKEMRAIMIINDRNIKTWSLIGQRATFGLIALEIVKE